MAKNYVEGFSNFLIGYNKIKESAKEKAKELEAEYSLKAYTPGKLKKISCKYIKDRESDVKIITAEAAKANIFDKDVATSLTKISTELEAWKLILDESLENILD